jgi:hypothetical protein
MAQCTAIHPVTKDRCNQDEGHDGPHGRTIELNREQSDALMSVLNARGVLPDGLKQKVKTKEN